MSWVKAQKQTCSGQIPWQKNTQSWDRSKVAFFGWKHLPTCCFRFYFGKCFTLLQHWSLVDLPRLCMCCWCHLPDSSESAKRRLSWKVQKASKISIPQKEGVHQLTNIKTVHTFSCAEKVLHHLICPYHLSGKNSIYPFLGQQLSGLLWALLFGIEWESWWRTKSCWIRPDFW